LTRDARRLLAWRLEDERQRNAARGEVLGQWLPKYGVGAELGVFQGRFSRTLLDLTDADRLHLIDPFYFLTAEWHWGWGNRNTVDVLIQILLEFKLEIETARVFVHVANDVPTLQQFDDQYLDWAYIDSSHQYEHTVKELDVLESKVKPEGIIAGDDWRPDPAHRHHGVCKAVSERVATGRYLLLGADEKTTQWAIKRA
jgi:hypothetical protein